MNKLKTEFKAYQPQIKPLGSNQGGGFQLVLEIPETQWAQIKDLNDPILKNFELQVRIKGKKVV